MRLTDTPVRNLIVRAGTAAAALCLTAGPLPTTHAINIFYDDSGGDFSSGASWVGGVAPGFIDTAIIDTGDPSISIDFVQNNQVQQLIVRNAGVTMDLGGFDLDTTFNTGLTVGSTGSLTSALTFQSSSPGGSVSANGINILAPSGGTADLTITGPNTTVTQSLFRNLTVGTNFNGGTASLHIADQATFSSGGAATITVGSAGSIDVDSDAVFAANGNINVNGGTITGLRSQTNFDWADNNTFTVRNGGSVSSAFSSQYDSPDNSTWVVTGAGSTVDGSGNQFDLVGGSTIDVNSGGAWTKRFIVKENSTVTADGVGTTLGDFTAHEGSVTLTDGATSSGTFYIIGDNISGLGAGLTGTLNILSGSSVSSSNTFDISTFSGDSDGVVNVSGSGSTLSVDDTTIGNTGLATGEVNVTGGGLFTTSGTTTLNPSGTINIDGGTALLGNYVDNGGTINFTAGTYGHNGDLIIDPAEQLGGNFSASNKSLVFGGTITVNPNSTLTIDGGRVSAGSIQNLGTLSFVTGTLELTGDDFEVDFGGLLGRTPTIATGQDLAVTNNVNVSSVGLLTIDGGSVTAGTLNNGGLIQMTGLSSLIDGGAVSNSGTIFGTGVVDSTLVNNPSGVVRSEAGDNLIFNAAGNTNNGTIDNLAGTVQFTGDLTNSSTGVIASRGALRLLGGLTNHGSVALDSGANDVFGSISNTVLGSVSVGNGATASFFGTVDNEGDIFVGTGSQATFYNDVSGSGSFSGTGTVEFTDGFSPGSSPGAIAFAGDVLLSGSADLSIELGGLIPGSEFDQLNVAGDIMLGGLLDISMLGGFMPSPGDTFQIINAASRTGEFASVTGNDLGGGIMLDVLYSPTGVMLQVTGGLAGDLDGDGFVGINDLNIVLGNWNQSVPPANPLADPSGDGFVGIDDLNAVLGNWNAGTPPSAGAAVPEPGTAAVLIGMGVMGVGRRWV